MHKRLRQLKHFFVPHAGNKYKPGIFALESVAVIVLVLCFFEGVYFVQSKIVLRQSGFMASVLPAAIVELTNGDRAGNGEQALAQDTLLAQAAQEKADDMAAKGYFAHVSPDGKTPWYWLQHVDYKYTYAGENLAINFNDSQDVETAWMNSSEHHANIVKPQYTQIGIGVAQGMYQGQSTTFVVELFAALPNSPAQASGQEPVAPATVRHEPKPPAAASAPRVLAAQSPPPASTPTGVIAAGTTSPNHVMTWVLVAFATIISILLGVAIFVKASKRKRYIEEVGGGLALIAAAACLLFFNAQSASSVQVPTDNQSASVALAL